jgi:hypothetical protein
VSLRVLNPPYRRRSSGIGGGGRLRRAILAALLLLIPACRAAERSAGPATPTTAGPARADRTDAQAAAAPSPAGPRAPQVQVARETVRLEVGPCSDAGTAVATRSSELRARQALCSAVVGLSKAGASGLLLRLEGWGEPAILEEQALDSTAATESGFGVRWPHDDAWPEGGYRVSLVRGEEAILFWDFEVRPDDLELREPAGE